MKTNPFFYGNPVRNELFIGRVKALRRVAGRILHGGQSTAIIGEPKIGKSSFLKYLVAPENSKRLYGERANSLAFSLIDIQAFGTELRRDRFWKQALLPICKKIEKTRRYQDLRRLYNTCHENNFTNSTLEPFLKTLALKGLSLALFIDEFDCLIDLPIDYPAEFFGGIRSLASRTDGALSITIASRLAVSRLNKISQELIPTGSPFFNIFPEITLGVFRGIEARRLLSIASNRFTTKDIDGLMLISGGHPCFLQAAGAAMWEAHEESIDQERRMNYVVRELYQQMDFHFTDSWFAWTPEMRKAFTAVALAQKVHLLGQQRIKTAGLIRQLSKLSPELNELEERGLIMRDKMYECGWSITCQIMLTWLADEILKAIRDDKPFAEWLSDEQLEGVFTKREKEAFEKVIKGTARILKESTTTFIESLARGLSGKVLG